MESIVNDMAGRAEQELLTVAGREVAISNPGKVLFPQTGYTKLDLARYYLAVAAGALQGAAGRPNVLVRYPDGIDGEFFFQKRAPRSRPAWVEVVALKFPSGRSAEEVVPRDAAAFVWMANLACLELHPHPVRADDLDHPDELRVDLDPVPGIEWPQISEGRRRRARDARRFRPRRLAENVRLARHARVRADRASLDLRRSAARRAGAGARRWNGARPSLATSKWWKEERHGVFLDYNQNAKDRTIASAYSVRPTPDARVSAPLAWDEIDACDPADFTLATMPARFARVGDRARGDGQPAVRARRAPRAFGPSGTRRSRRRAVAAALPEAARRRRRA